MAKTQYAFRMKFYGDLDAQVVGEYLEELIDKKNEHVTNEEIEAAARPAHSPIHQCFTFDDAEAATKWRKVEANRLVKSLASMKGGEMTKTRPFLYVHHPEYEGKKVLMTTRSAMGRPEMREQVIENAVKSLQRSLNFWGNAYGGNSSLRALAKDVEALKRKAQRELLQAF